MTMRRSPKLPKSSSPSPRRYLKPGALAKKLRDSKKIKANRKLQNQINLLELSTTTPISPPSFSPSPQNLDNVVPCFDPTFNRPRCLARKKLFAVTPVFTEHTDTYLF
ncbi:hypothetical protein MTR_8g468940 [Medicago truncatula]|uniref:Uncharacterized protein n=1 Tax=Medicago truncatula TaxID=3880 RepID=A0A072U228_MEDTR|nr:hypothetical protein MTR_8g468940 [Medicago truncatula]